MHELAMTHNLLDLALRKAIERQAKRVTDLNMVIGHLASIQDDWVQFYFNELSRGTLCDQARLHFERVPAQLECLDCRQNYEPAGDLRPCPHCGSANVHVVSGDELYLESIEIEGLEGVLA